MDWTLSSLVASLLLIPIAQGGDIYVNNISGNDDLSGVSETIRAGGGPVRTIQRALCLAKVGDTIHLADTALPYREMVSIAGRIRGTERRPILLDGHGATLDGTVEANPQAWRHVGKDVYAVRPHRLAYQQLFRDGVPLQRVQRVLWEESTPQLRALEWALLQSHIYVCVEENSLPQDYRFRYSGLQTGISIYNSQHIVIKNLIVQGFQQDGINVHDTTKNCRIEGVECRANGRSGVSVGGASRVAMRDMSLYDNGRSNLRVEGYARVEAERTDVDQEQADLAIDLQGGQLVFDGREMRPNAIR